jgi:hypothetical protein
MLNSAVKAVEAPPAEGRSMSHTHIEEEQSGEMGRAHGERTLGVVSGPCAGAGNLDRDVRARKMSLAGARPARL